MTTYLHPGVYVEEIPSGVRPIEGVSTSTAAILGYAAKGPVGEPELIFKWDDYVQQYGGIRDLPAGSVDSMGYSVSAFFQNGGRKAYIVRLAVDADAAFSALPLPSTPDDDMVLKFEAVNEGTWGDNLAVSLVQQADQADGHDQFTLVVSQMVDGLAQPREQFSNLTFVEGHSGYIKDKVNGNSLLVKVDLVESDDSAFLRGTAISGDLKTLVPTVLNGKTLSVVVDGGSAVNVAFAAGRFTAGSTLAQVAEAIQDKVREGSGVAYENFTAVASNHRLVLTSGSRTAASAVTATGGDAAAELNFAANKGGTAVTGAGWLELAFTPNYPAYSLSGDLAGLDLTSLNSTGMKVTVDSTDRTVTFGASDFDSSSTLADVAARIQEDVRGSTSNRHTRDFTATVDDDTIRLVSGGGESDSSVVVAGPGSGTNAAPLLKLGGSNGGTEKTGQEAMLELLADDGIEATFLGGNDGDEPGIADYQGSFQKFRKIRDASIFLLPGQVYADAGKSVIDAAISHAEFMKNRMVIVDPPDGTELVAPTDVSKLGLPTSTYTVLYYPYVKVRNPYYDEEKRPDRAKTVLVPPSGFAAGIWARTDGRRGVWKAPAGVETSLSGADSLEYVVGNDEQDQLNPLGVNCIRQLPVAGLAARVIWGSRTLATRADPEWRYVPVRRTAMFIEESIYNAIHWAVFEPNDHPLWSSLRVNIGSFMNGLFRAGAFQGKKASDAYFVRCGLGDTMTQGDIDRGQVIVIVGFAPLKPAEFVIVRIQQKVQQQ